MAQVSKVAVSRLIASHEEEESDDKKKSRDDFKKQKELEEQRKLGNAPAAVDEEGKDINPHIPQYISEAPWYLDPKGPTLKHQRPQEERQKEYSGISEWYKKGSNAATGKIATKYRKGACENCGALTHKKRDCLERPRKVGAKYTGSNFAPDEHVQPDLKLSFDGKRDRWNGYDNFAHQEVVEEFNKLEEVKKEVKKERLKAGLGNPEEDDGAPSSDEDEDKYVDKMDMPGTKVDAAERYTVRNLRIREDTAKYLRNLDLSSAHYDPKTRSMRKNPYESTGLAKEEVDYAGDNFVRITGDTVNHAQSQMFAWDAGRKGLEVHALAEPTKLEALKKEFAEKKDKLENKAKNAILEKYGGQEHLDAAPPRELIFAQTENYVEYTRSGKVIRGEEEKVVRSRYPEDVHPGNHTSVWGSFWHEGKWGYKCCYAFLKQAYCTGATGRENFESVLASSNAAAAAAAEAAKAMGEEEGEGGESSKKKHKKKKKKKDKKKKDDDEEEDFESQVAKAMKKLDKEDEKAMSMMDDRKRGYNSMKGTDDVAKAPSEAEMEAFYRKRQRTDDPMAKFL